MTCIKDKTVKPLVVNIGEYLFDIKIEKDFLNKTQKKHKLQRKRLIHLIVLTLRTYCPQKLPQTK